MGLTLVSLRDTDKFNTLPWVETHGYLPPSLRDDPEGYIKT